MLRVKIPQRLSICGNSEDPLKIVSAAYSYKRYAITLTLEDGEVKKATWAKPEDDTQWYRESTYAELVITDTAKSHRSITDLITPSAHEYLLDLIEEAVMKVIRVIRNVGFVPELRESLPRNKPPDEILRSWKPEVASDGDTWANPLPPSSEGRYGFAFWGFQSIGFCVGF